MGPDGVHREKASDYALVTIQALLQANPLSCDPYLPAYLNIIISTSLMFKCHERSGQVLILTLLELTTPKVLERTRALIPNPPSASLSLESRSSKIITVDVSQKYLFICRSTDPK